MGKAAGKKRPNAAKRDEIVPKRTAFMQGVSLKRLSKARKKEKAGKSKYRLHADILRKEGKGIRKISRMLGYGLLYRPGLAGPHARGQPEEAVRP